jgi:hypothetical protein
MHSVLRTLFVAVPLGLTLSLSLAGCAPAAEPAAEDAEAQEMAPVDDGALAADLLKDWEGMKELMVALADAMPAENYGYKPTDELRNFGEQLMHITGAQVGLMNALGSDATAPDLGEPTEKADIMAAMTASFDFGSEVLRGQSSAWFQEVVSGGFLGESTRARVVYRNMVHTWSEYGVMTVYLRLNDIVPPASQ